MTNREFYMSVIEKLGAETEEGTYAQAQLTKMDAQLAKRRDTMSEKQKENEALGAEILRLLEPGTVYTAAQAAALYGEITPQKASRILQMLAANGELVQTDVVVKANKAEGVKAKRVKGYYWNA